MYIKNERTFNFISPFRTEEFNQRVKGFIAKKSDMLFANDDVQKSVHMEEVEEGMCTLTHIFEWINTHVDNVQYQSSHKQIM